MVLQIRIFLEPNGKIPQRGKRGDAGIDVFADVRGGGVVYPATAQDFDKNKNEWVEVDVKPHRVVPGDSDSYFICQGDSAKIPLGFHYSFWESYEIHTPGEREIDADIAWMLSHDYFLDIRNRSGVGTKSGMATIAEVGDANYRGIIHYCVAKIARGAFTFTHGEKIAQAIICPFVDPHKVEIVQVSSIEELGPSARGSQGFGDSGSK